MISRVLIIEDDPDIAEILRYGFEKKGFETRVALNGEEGLTASLDKDSPPSIILLDLLLPGMNGFELCRRLRSEPLTQNTPIVIISATASENAVAAGLELGISDYIVKPFTISQVFGRIDAVLRIPDSNP